MVFSSAVFLFAFLPLTIFGYFLLPRKWRNAYLMLASLVFYAWGEPKFVLVMIASILMNYLFGLLVVKKEEEACRKRILVLMVIANLSLLFVFKYLNFTVANLNVLFHGRIPQTHIVLPIGISFFTFQAMSYVFDVSMGRGKVQKNPLNVALYIALFPQLIAGPIVRYQTVADEIQDRNENLEDFARGIRRFVIGLGKKMLLSNSIALLADQTFDCAAPGSLSVATAWLGALAYAFQIYFDFGGYSDMAIGLGLMFGFHFDENFNYPYISRTVSEFWQRWHISLSSWFRDYLFYPVSRKAVPLGQKARKRWGKTVGRLVPSVIALSVVWLSTGIWLDLYPVGRVLRHSADLRPDFCAPVQEVGKGSAHPYPVRSLCGLSDPAHHDPGAAGLCAVPLHLHAPGVGVFRSHVWPDGKRCGRRCCGDCAEKSCLGTDPVRIGIYPHSLLGSEAYGEVRQL